MAACLDAGGGWVRILVDDRDAAYPLRVDPVMTSPAWSADMGQECAYFGDSVGAAGDVDGDGYDDLIVGADLFDVALGEEGRVWVYHGSASGLAPAPAWVEDGPAINGQLGGSVSTAGDVDGDGYADVLVSAPYLDLGEGRVYAYHGSASGLGAVPAWIADHDVPGAQLGLSAAPAGDVDGDGHDDVILGAPGEDRAYVYRGSPSGLVPAASWVAVGDQPGSEFGRSVAPAGDVDGDGYADVLVGARYRDGSFPNEGRAYAYRGSASGLEAAPSWVVDGGQAGADLGYSLGTAGDVNGDGYADVVIGVRRWDGGETDEGRVLVYHGSASGLAAAPAWSFEVDQDGADLGWSVGTAGDVNGDGYGDVIVTALRYTEGEFAEGKVYVFEGSSSGLGATPAWTGQGDQEQCRYGDSVLTAGDVNGDGYGDVAIGVKEYTNVAYKEGRAYVYHGSAAGLAPSPAMTASGGQGGADLGRSVASAGDVDGDGHADLVLGAPGFDAGGGSEGRVLVFLGTPSGPATSASWIWTGSRPGERLGASVGGAGDVNGDGWSDVAVGAPGFDGGAAGEGRVLVFAGSPAGVRDAPLWSAEGGRAGAMLGASVGTAGDVDGDGFSDVIVGAPGWDGGEAGEGAAFAFLGSAAGPAAAPSWSVESDQAGAMLGASVGSAGDVDGDGFSDVVVGAPGWDGGDTDEGAALVFLGSALGPVPAASWTVEGGRAGAMLGASVGSAGDVDGDGFSDVIAGAPGWDGGEPAEGRVQVHHGSAAGLAAAAAFAREGDEAGAMLGASVAGAGDVNGDGWSDVVVGAPGHAAGAGAASVHHGSPAGVVAIEGWRADGAGAGDALGAAVAGAGDVNGDGHSDVAAGAPGRDGAAIDEGAAYLHLGNGGDGVARTRRQSRADASAPVDLLGAVPPADGFLVEAAARSPWGRDRVRIEWEVKPLAVPFDGAGIARSAWTDTGVPAADGSVVALAGPSGPLPAAGPYKWRVRLRSRFPYPWHSHWMTVHSGAVTETDLRAADPAPCVVAALGRVVGLLGVKRPAGAARFEWSPDPAAAGYHLDAVRTKGELIDPRLAPTGNGELRCATGSASSTTCVDGRAAADALPVLYYQALSACALDGASEGPF